MDEDPKVRAILQHIGRGKDLADFLATRSEKRALIAAAERRGLIAWEKGHGRYKLTSRGRRTSRHRAALRSRLRFSAKALAITVAAVALGLSLSVGVSGLLVARQTRAVALPSTMPVPTIAAMNISQPVPADEANDKVDQRQGAQETSTEPAQPDVQPPKPVMSEAKSSRQDEPQRAAEPRRKVAKKHRKRLHVSRLRRHQSRHAFRLPSLFSFGRQSNWSSFR